MNNSARRPQSLSPWKVFSLLAIVLASFSTHASNEAETSQLSFAKNGGVVNAQAVASSIVTRSTSGKATILVSETYVNQTDDEIVATYQFPTPNDAEVLSFEVFNGYEYDMTAEQDPTIKVAAGDRVRIELRYTQAFSTDAGLAVNGIQIIQPVSANNAVAEVD